MCAAFTEDIRQLLDTISHYIGDAHPSYLVGGAVRDILLNREIKDLDISVAGDVFQDARKVANSLNGAYYPMDEEHGTARVILEKPNGDFFYIDFNKIRGMDIYQDLADRDFTINAMALELPGEGDLIDPLNGAQDLLEKRLIPCGPFAILHDPIRAIRGVRFAVEFGLMIPSETVKAIKDGAVFLNNVSIERVRDEFFKILEGKDPVISIRLLERFGVLPVILPELAGLQNLTQSLPHIDNAWEHTINTVKQLQDVIIPICSEYDPGMKANFVSGYLSLKLGRYRSQIRSHLSHSLVAGRSRKALLLMAALYHDTGKPATRSVDGEDRVRFLEHENESARLARHRARALHLSNDEVEALQQIIQGHMRPILLSNQAEQPSPRAIYRYFRKTGTLGIDICLLSLADTLATYGMTLPDEKWIKFVDTIRILMEAYWERSEQSISPPALLTGKDLIEIFQLKPGPLIGHLLENVRLAQVEDSIQGRDEALEYVMKMLEENLSGEDSLP